MPGGGVRTWRSKILATILLLLNISSDIQSQEILLLKNKVGTESAWNASKYSESHPYLRTVPWTTNERKFYFSIEQFSRTLSTLYIKATEKWYIGDWSIMKLPHEIAPACQSSWASETGTQVVKLLWQQDEAGIRQEILTNPSTSCSRKNVWINPNRFLNQEDRL